MKLVRFSVVAGLVAAVLILTGCNQATEAKKEAVVVPTGIEDFEGFADTAALVTVWPKNIWDSKSMASGNVSLETTAPLTGTKSLKIQYGANTQFGLSDFPTNKAAFFTNVKDHFTADRTGIKLKIKRADWDAIYVIIRGASNNEAFQAKISDTLYHSAGGDIVEIPFGDFSSQSWGGTSTYSTLKAALAAGYAFSDFTIEPEVDDTTTTPLNSLKDLWVDDISYY